MAWSMPSTLLGRNVLVEVTEVTFSGSALKSPACPPGGLGLLGSPNPSLGLVFLESASLTTSEQRWCHRPFPWRWGRAHGPLPPPTCSEKQRLTCGPAAFSSARRWLALSSCCAQTVDDISAIGSGEILHTPKIPMSGLS